MAQITLKRVLPEKKWDSIESLDTLNRLNPKIKDDLCTIFLDVKGSQPELLKVEDHILQPKNSLFIDFAKISDLKVILGTLLIKFDAELMACLQESQVAKRAGKYRKFDDIVKECNL